MAPVVDTSVPVRPDIDLRDESDFQKLTRKSKDSPLMIAGLSSFFIIAAYGIYRFKHRGNLSASNYLMQLRVTAQGAVLGCLTVGVISSLYDRFKHRQDSK